MITRMRFKYSIQLPMKRGVLLMKKQKQNKTKTKTKTKQNKTKQNKTNKNDPKKIGAYQNQNLGA